MLSDNVRYLGTTIIWWRIECGRSSGRMRSSASRTVCASSLGSDMHKKGMSPAQLYTSTRRTRHSNDGLVVDALVRQSCL